MRFWVIVSAAAVLALSTAAAMADGAVAVGDGRYAISVNHHEMRHAEHRALEECGRGCRVVMTFSRQCAAFASSPRGAEGWGRGRSAEHAKRRAVEECHGHEGHRCEVRAVRCDD